MLARLDATTEFLLVSVRIICSAAGLAADDLASSRTSCVTRQPPSTKRPTIDASPYEMATSRAVRPDASRRSSTFSSSFATSSKALTHSVSPSTAKCNGVHPSAFSTPAGTPPSSSVRTASIPVSVTSIRATYFDAINDVKYNSLDPYARAQSAYYQQRNGLLRDNLPIDEKMSDFDNFFE